MESAAICAAVEELPYGKRLPWAVYVWDDGECLPPTSRRVCVELRRRLEIGGNTVC